MAGGTLSVGRTADGYCLRLHGRCTMNESPAAHAFVERSLREGAQSVYVDVSDCAYLDSTFLGSLLDLHRRHGKEKPAKFSLLATEEARAKLFQPTHLHKVFNFADAAPGSIEAWVDLPCLPARTPGDLARHVMECHQRLAEVDGPSRASFAAVAQQLERELSKSAGAGANR